MPPLLLPGPGAEDSRCRPPPLRTGPAYENRIQGYTPIAIYQQLPNVPYLLFFSVAYLRIIIFFTMNAGESVDAAPVRSKYDNQKRFVRAKLHACLRRFNPTFVWMQMAKLILHLVEVKKIYFLNSIDISNPNFMLRQLALVVSYVLIEFAPNKSTKAEETLILIVYSCNHHILFYFYSFR